MSVRLKLEASFDGTGSSWVDLSNSSGVVGAKDYLLVAGGIDITRGREDESGEPISPGSLSFQLDNADGRFSPGITSGPYYPYLEKPGPLLKLSAWVGGAWRVRFYGVAQSWTSNTQTDSTGKRVVCTVVASDVLAAFPRYTFRQPADEVIRALPGVVAHWALRNQESPASPLVGPRALLDNGGDGWGQATGLLAMEDGTDAHPLFKSSAGGLTVHASELALSGEWSALMVLWRPSANATVMGGFRDAITSAAQSLTITSGKVNNVAAVSSWPVVIGVRNSTLYGMSEFLACNAAGSISSAGSGNVLQDPTRISVNPTLSGGAQFDGAHLVLLDHYIEDADLQALAGLLLGGRVPTATSAVELLRTWAGAMPITGAVDGETRIPTLGDRDAAEAMGALVKGMGARLSDNLDGTLRWIPFPPSDPAVTVPKVTRDMSWGSSSAGWVSDVTVTRGTLSYTTADGDGKQESAEIEGVHASWDLDCSYADWIKNTAGMGGRCPVVPVDMLALTETQRVGLCAVGPGSRLAPPAQSYMPASLIVICEGLSEHIDHMTWAIAFKTSPDIYSRLFIWDDPVQGVLDAGYLLGP